ncbi:uncharacterized protein SPAPADRAFT_155618 [Spathaspora passalidarum NRRL Y-27907]|uniref:TATA element modulatory factor 1 TATA binding domain-containing protein n=1 Tax=Spathaspora passalidarum (strain NRRL Y-27907 / 11-Y1) TaxID=619300 RepID=G3AS23_SPAPN|nr:uncharacterized protein SPAPADRAFT_155618 [Spathaspora passalidarum NRRL Y-27907]EGW31872.1 hypothetical protein SPAPADRAFT_155618 [Spathaspora passalidarum NRRL Y-27907]
MEIKPSSPTHLASPDEVEDLISLNEPIAEVIAQQNETKDESQQLDSDEVNNDPAVTAPSDEITQEEKITQQDQSSSEVGAVLQPVKQEPIPDQSQKTETEQDTEQNLQSENAPDVKVQVDSIDQTSSALGPEATEKEPEQNKESSDPAQESEKKEPEPQTETQTETKAESEPVPKKPVRKRLTLQERLAQAAKGKSKKSTKSKSPSAEPPASTTATPAPQPVVDTVIPEEAPVEIASPSAVSLTTVNPFEKEREELLRKISAQESMIKELREEGESLSHKELKLNDTIKKLKNTNLQLEENLQDYLIKSDESSLKLQEFQEFLRLHKFKSFDQFKEKFGELNYKLANTTQELEQANGLQQKYSDLVLTHEQEVSLNKATVKELNDLKIQIDIMKSQHSLELDSKENILQDLKNELMSAKQSYGREISRLEDKIENLRLEQESNVTISETSDESDKGKIEEFIKLSESHHNLQKQYLSSQQNWKVIESNLLLKIDNLTNTIEQLKKQKNKLTQDLTKVNNLLISSDNEVRKLTQEVTTLEQQIQNHELSIKIKENDFVELQDKFDKLQHIYNQDRAKLNTKIETLNDTIEKLKEQQKSASELQLNLDNSTRQISLGNLSAASWNDIRFGESSTTPAINRDFSGIYIDNSRNQSSTSFTEIGVEDGYDLRGESVYNHLGNIPTSSHSNNIQLVNKMSSTIRRLEIELNTLKDEYSKLSMDKEKLEQELFESLKLNDEMSQMNVQIDELKKQISEKDRKEQTMLELIGEKSEQVEELKADVFDLKELCKLQVQQMIEIQQKK